MKKELIPLLIPLAIVGLVLTMGQPYQQNNIRDSTKPQGNIYICVEKFTGTECHWIQNTVTNIAKNQTRDIRMGRIPSINITSIPANTTWSSLILSADQGPVNATTTLCPNEYVSNGMTPVNGTISEVTDSIGNYSITHKWTATGTTSAIYKLCLSNYTSATAGGSLMASGFINNTISGYVLDANENITAYYYIAET